jgi:hypothetical protein
VVPIWVGSTRQGFAGMTKTFDFRLRVSPAGGGTSSARSFEARFVHQPFLGPKMFGWSLLTAVIAAIVGMLFVIGFSSVGRAATAIKCGFDDDFEETKGVTLIKEDCGGAFLKMQRDRIAGVNTTTSVTPRPGVTGTPTAAPRGTTTPTPAAGACRGDPALNNSVGKPVTVRIDAIRRQTPSTSGVELPDRGGNRPGGISAGPVCADDLVWWEVDIGGSKAWTAEQDQRKVPLLLPR